MFNLELEVYLASVLVLAILHTLGEVLYKNATTSFVRLKGIPRSQFSFRTLNIPLVIKGVSIGISLGVKIIYGIFLGLNPLSVTAGLFLGSIAIFSIIFGKLFFHEQVSPYQILGYFDCIGNYNFDGVTSGFL